MDNLVKGFAELSLNDKQPGSRGRSAALLHQLKTIGKPKARFEKYTGSEGVVINLISNSVSITSSIVYLYESFFNTNLDIGRRCSFLKRSIRRLGIASFATNGRILYTATKLTDDQLQFTLHNPNLQTSVTAQLLFKSCLPFNESVLELILGDATIVDGKVVRVYKGTIHCTYTGNVLSVKECDFVLDDANFSTVVSNFVEKHEDKHESAMKFLLGNVTIFEKTSQHVFPLHSCQITEKSISFKLHGYNADAKSENCNVVQESKRIVAPNVTNIHTILENDWNIKSSSFIKVKGRVLNRPVILFGDNTYVPENGMWDNILHKSDFYEPVTLVGWIILHLPNDLKAAQALWKSIDKFQDSSGMTIGQPLFIPIRNRTKSGLLSALRFASNRDVEFILVLVPEPDPTPFVKHICCTKRPKPCLTFPASAVTNREEIFSIVCKMNVILGGSLWSVVIVQTDIMFCGVNVQTSNTKSVCSFVSSLNDADVSQWYSKCDYFIDFKECFTIRLNDAVEKFKHMNGFLPKKVIVYQNYSEKCDLFTAIKIPLCIVYVDSNTNKAFYTTDATQCFCSAPAGSVVDDVVIEPCTKGFYLSSNASKFVFYKIIQDFCNFKADEIQTLTYKLCHAYCKRAKIGKMPAPLLYAKKLSKFVLRTILDIPSSQLDSCLFYL